MDKNPVNVILLYWMPLDKTAFVSLSIWSHYLPFFLSQFVVEEGGRE